MTPEEIAAAIKASEESAKKERKQSALATSAVSAKSAKEEATTPQLSSGALSVITGAVPRTNSSRIPVSPLVTKQLEDLSKIPEPKSAMELMTSGTIEDWENFRDNLKTDYLAYKEKHPFKAAGISMIPIVGSLTSTWEKQEVDANKDATDSDKFWANLGQKVNMASDVLLFLAPLVKSVGAAISAGVKGAKAAKTTIKIGEASKVLAKSKIDLAAAEKVLAEVQGLVDEAVKAGKTVGKVLERKLAKAIANHKVAGASVKAAEDVLGALTSGDVSGAAKAFKGLIKFAGGALGGAVGGNIGGEIAEGVVKEGSKVAPVIGAGAAGAVKFAINAKDKGGTEAAYGRKLAEIRKKNQEGAILTSSEQKTAEEVIKEMQESAKKEEARKRGELPIDINGNIIGDK